VSDNDTIAHQSDEEIFALPPHQNQIARLLAKAEQAARNAEASALRARELQDSAADMREQIRQQGRHKVTICTQNSEPLIAIQRAKRKAEWTAAVEALEAEIGCKPTPENVHIYRERLDALEAALPPAPSSLDVTFPPNPLAMRALIKKTGAVAITWEVSDDDKLVGVAHIVE
jgi:hypothetical protein